MNNKKHTADNTIKVKKYASPCGDMLIGAFDDRLCICDWMIEKHHATIRHRLEHALNAVMATGEGPLLDKASDQLDEYFAGNRTVFDIPLLFVGTEFQKLAWLTLTKIPYGTTISYAEMARRMGMPNAVRAVASANRANAVSIFAPCHRVIGSNNTLVGYGGGLPAKQYLLNLESGEKQTGTTTHNGDRKTP